MKILIIYDSLYGNTKNIASAIKEKLETNNETKLLKADNFNIDSLKEVDLLIVGSPTHAGRFSEPVSKFLNKLPQDSLKGIKSASFDTAMSAKDSGLFLKIIIKIFGYASPKISKELENKGAKSIKYKTFIVLSKEGPLKEGELKRAKVWANELTKNINKIKENNV